MKELTLKNYMKIDGITASYIDNRVSIEEELEYLGVSFDRDRNTLELIEEFKSDDYFIDESNYQITDLEKVEKFKAKE